MESACIITNAGIDLDFESFAAHVTELGHLRNNVPRHFRNTLKVVHIAIRTEQATAIIFALTTGDDGRGDGGVHTGNELEDTGRGSIEIYFSERDGRKQINQPDRVTLDVGITAEVI